MSSKTRSPSTSFLILLGAPSLGLAFSETMMSTYLPSVLHNLANPITIGAIIGAEGAFGMFAPTIFGALADRVDSVGGRLRYLWPSTILMAASIGLVAQFNLLFIIAIMVALFYVGYYGYLAPYWALYPDLIPDDFSGRSRSAEGIWRIVGAMLALVSGGFLIGLWQPLPFVIAGCLVIAVTLLLRPVLGDRKSRRISKSNASIKKAFINVYLAIKNKPDVRNLFFANALWNATLRSIMSFTVLFFTVGMGRSHHFVAGVIFPIAAIGIVIMGPLAGKLADNIGHIKVLTVAILVYGFGDLVPGITQRYWVIFIIPIVSAAAATIMVLPYSLMMRIMDENSHGEFSGLFGVSRGLGSFLGPLLTGVAVAVGKNFLTSTDGYAAFWLAAGIYVLASLFFLRKIKGV